MTGPTPTRTPAQDAEYHAHDAKARAGELVPTPYGLQVMRELEELAVREERAGREEKAWDAREDLMTQLMLHRRYLIDLACVANRQPLLALKEKP